MLRIDSKEEIAGAIRTLKGQSGIEGLVLCGQDADEVWDWFRAGYRSVLAAGGCVTDGRGRLLAIHRSGVWDLPKGKLDEGESSEGAAVREVREECGLRRVELGARLCETWHTYERKGEQFLKRTDWYLMRASSQETLVAQAEEGIDEVRWMDADGVAQLKAGTYPSLLKVISAWEAAVRRSA